MKRIIFLMIALLCIIVSCSKDAGWGTDQSPEMTKLNALFVHNPTIIVAPDQNGNDTGNLKDAIASATPGTTIRLLEGTYHVGYFEMLGFDGSIVGAGQNKTIIVPSGLFDAKSQVDKNLLPTWWHIIGGNVTISDLTFNTGNGVLITEADPYFGKTLPVVIVVNNYNADYNNTERKPMNFLFKNVTLIAGRLPIEYGYMGTDYNTIMNIWIGDDEYWPSESMTLTAGKYMITNCNFDQGIDAIEAFSAGENAVVNICGNTFSNCAEPLYFTANYNSRINILNNTFRNSSWFDIMAEDNDYGMLGFVNPVRRCEYLISGNNFNVQSGANCIIVKDNWCITHPEKYQPIKAIIRNNLFTMTDANIGISCQNIIEAEVLNNRFIGSSQTGIYVDGADVLDPVTYESLGSGWSKEVLLLGNNLARLEGSIADIWFGPKSVNCTVVGLSSDSVLDEGTNNHITGLKYEKPGYHKGSAPVNDLMKIQHMRLGPGSH